MSPEQLTTTHRIKNPRAKANLLSVITFSWFVPTFVKAYRKDLEENDLFETLPEHRSAFLGNKLEETWQKESKKENPSLWRALAKIFGWKLAMLGLVTFFIEIVLKIGQTLALGRLIYYYTPHQTDITKNEAYMYAGVIVACSFLSVLMIHNNVMALQHLGMKVRVAACSLIYRKSLRLSKTALAETTIGQLVNLLSNDVSRFDHAAIHVNTIWISPVQTIFVMYLSYIHVGWTGIIGVAFMMMFIPLQIYLGKRSSILRLKVAIKTDERVRLMNEIITGINVIKMYAWEKSFAKLVSIARRLEIKQVKGASYVKAVHLSFSICLSGIAIFLSILTYVLLGNILRAEYAFVISSFYIILKHSMTVGFPNGITQIAEANVSVNRLQKFLLLDEIEALALHQSSQMNGVLEQPVAKLRINMKNATGKWMESLTENTLMDINLKAYDSQLIAVIGSVGCGKSSLLNAILRELKLTDGEVKIKGKISYVSQEAWLFGGTIRENILFGQPYDEEKYRTVLNVCALERDVAIFSHGDQSMVGERGVTLSGGQKARINLARAVYKDSDIYLLDDPLAAVDTYVGNQLFQKCISGYLKDKCTILVTNQLQFLYSVDRIILLEKGKVAADGTYQELLESGLDFAKLLERKHDDDANANKAKSLVDMDLEDNNTILENKESKRIGSIEKRVYRAYFRAGGKLYICVLLFAMFVIAQISISGSDYFLGYWTNLEQRRAETNSTQIEDVYLTRNSTVIIYAAIVGFSFCIVFFRLYAFFKYCMRASRKLHDKMFYKIATAPMRFFNTNSSGRILNRFSKDMGSIDEQLPYILVDTLQIGLKVLGIMLVVASVNPYQLPVSLVMLIVFYLLRTVYLSTSRDVKRLEGVTRSPVFTHMNASLQGLSTIRAFEAQEMLKFEFDIHQDNHSSAWYMVLGSSRAFGFWLDMICVFYIGSVTISFLLMENEMYGGNVGLAITQASMLTGTFQWGIRQWSELENQMTSVERVVEYTNIVNEDQEGEDQKLPPSSWPSEGCIEFKDVSLRYSVIEQYVLKNLSFVVEPREKVGIVGRTGAGKSSLITALFQLVKTEGQIIIDGLDITNYPLQSVRSKISIIPQEPVLFSGTLRKNLDPFDEYSDVDLWNALEEVELKSTINEKPAALNTRMSEGGANFSVGQRQLFCLARAIVRNNKILVLDEATANVDPHTDSLIQNTIRKKFASCTVLTIAHRLHTVMDSDKVLVMDAGRMVEFDHPYKLLERKGWFYGLVQETGKAMAQTLSNVAEENYKTNYGNTS